MTPYCRTCRRPLTADEQADPRDPDICDDCLWRELDQNGAPESGSVECCQRALRETER